MKVLNRLHSLLELRVLFQAQGVCWQNSVPYGWLRSLFVGSWSAGASLSSWMPPTASHNSTLELVVFETNYLSFNPGPVNTSCETTGKLLNIFMTQISYKVRIINCAFFPKLLWRLNELLYVKHVEYRVIISVYYYNPN